MINFNEQTSLMEPGMILLSWTIVGDQYKYGPQPVEAGSVQETKNNIVRKAICSRISSLLAQRKNAYLHSGGHRREETLKAVQHLEYNLVQLRNFTNMLQFFEYAVEEVLPHLETIQPAKESRFVNYHSALITLNGFCDRCLRYYEKIQQTRQKQPSETA